MWMSEPKGVEFLESFMLGTTIQLLVVSEGDCGLNVKA